MDMPQLFSLMNRQLNTTVINNKVFCIGLHKTGTTSLSNLAEKYGFKVTHSKEEKLRRYDFFSDGGSHFDNINEFDFVKLFETYPDSKFILQTRATEKWVVSKLKHAGWHQDTRIMQDDIKKINHEEWRYKSLLTIQKFIEHKFNYESKVVSFFEERNSERLLILDITNPAIQHLELQKLIEFLNLKSFNPIKLPHCNQQRAKVTLPEIVKTHIRKVTQTTHRQQFYYQSLTPINCSL